MSSTLERFLLVQRRLLERAAESPGETPRVLLTRVLPRRRLRHAHLELLDLAALLRAREAREQELGDEVSPPPAEVVLSTASAAAELAFLCHHPQAPAPRHLVEFLGELSGLPSALVPATVREHAIECLWNLGGVAHGLAHGLAGRVRGQALRAAGHLVLVAEITGALDAALARLDPADDGLWLPEL